ncbi:thioredoxin family protein [Sphingomonas sp. 28-63-12]|uniref:DUF1223 domain-containing protein n=1 Tax=Sphingomonas sp. 28-63-12 TaxID=1970434 RepID=UPI000BC7FB9B|nr:MAG: hypothetical protein B7Y47_05325 [Sphingomonas sp. 28-63-12]
MRAILAVSTALFVAACSGATATPSANAGVGTDASTASARPAAFVGDVAHPTVIELYQSQGCSSCPPADAVVNKIADRKDVIALSFAVTYWDDLGWKDSFGSPAFTARQWDYAHSAGRGQVATPQVIVNGRDAVLGSREGELNEAIARNANTSGPDIAVAGNNVTVGAGKGAATVWVVRYDPRTIDVAIAAGENGGRTIPHRNIVRQLTSLGQWQGTAASFALPAAPAGLATAVLVQQGKGGPIIAARKI